MKLHLISSRNPKLRKISEPIEDFKKAKSFAKKMLIFAQNNDGAAGLAAIQVGKLQQIFVINFQGVKKIIINPILFDGTRNKIRVEEICLSFPGLRKYITRNKIIKVRYHNGDEVINEKLENFMAIIFQHEYDHLQGICIDKK